MGIGEGRGVRSEELGIREFGLLKCFELEGDFMKYLIGVIATLSLAFIILTALSACGETAPLPETAAELTQEEVEILIEEMLDIVWVSMFKEIGESIRGYFYTRDGKIYFWNSGEINFSRIDEFDFPSYGQLWRAVIDDPRNSQVQVDKEVMLDMYSKLMQVDINAEVNSWNNPADVYITHQRVYYGIRHNKAGEIEIILLGGNGMDIYENTDSNAEEIYQWLRTS